MAADEANSGSRKARMSDLQHSPPMPEEDSLSSSETPKSPLVDSTSSATTLADKGYFSKSGLGGPQESPSLRGKDLRRGSVQSGRRCFEERKKQLTGDRLCPMEIRVIDETALIGSVFTFLNTKSATKNGKGKLDGKKMAKGLRRREMKGSEKAKMVYSRERLEALRFSNVDEQRKMWKDVHTGLGPIVRKEYDFLLTLRPTKNIHLNFGPTFPPRRFVGKFDTPAFDSFAGRGRVNEVNVSAN